MGSTKAFPNNQDSEIHSQKYTPDCDHCGSCYYHASSSVSSSQARTDHQQRHPKRLLWLTTSLLMTVVWTLRAATKPWVQRILELVTGLSSMSVRKRKRKTRWSDLPLVALCISRKSSTTVDSGLSSLRFVTSCSHHLSSLKLNIATKLCTVLLLSVIAVADGAKGGGFRCKDSSSTLACLPEEYSKFELPMKVGVNNIGVSIHIDEVLRINDKDYSITFSCYFNVKWPESRIRLRQDFGVEQAKSLGTNVNITNNPDIMVPMNLEMVNHLWLPNIFIYNLKTYKVMDVLNKLAGLWVGGDYAVTYSQSTHITFICPMHFDKFPLDTQRCKFQVGSYSYDDTIMVFKTETAGYLATTGNSIALDYAITIQGLSDEDKVFQGGAMGNFSLAGFEMILSRYVSTYIITYYLPSGLFVIVSWISFLIPMDVIPGRMALLVTLFLVLVNIFNTVTTNTPKAEGLTAIEAWMLACILFVFGALIEWVLLTNHL